MKIFTGIVKAKKREKTATVVVSTLVGHPVYKKYLRRSKKYQVHDELGVKPGDKVRFIACKPVSKNKKWKISEVVNNKKINKE